MAKPQQGKRELSWSLVLMIAALAVVTTLVLTRHIAELRRPEPLPKQKQADPAPAIQAAEESYQQTKRRRLMKAKPRNKNISNYAGNPAPRP